MTEAWTKKYCLLLTVYNILSKDRFQRFLSGKGYNKVKFHCVEWNIQRVDEICLTYTVIFIRTNNIRT